MRLWGQPTQNENTYSIRVSGTGNRTHYYGAQDYEFDTYEEWLTITPNLLSIQNTIHEMLGADDKVSLIENAAETLGSIYQYYCLENYSPPLLESAGSLGKLKFSEEIKAVPYQPD